MQQDFYRQGLECLQVGDRQGALVAFDQALQENPQLVSAYMKRASLRADLGDQGGALADYNQALQQQPSPEGHLSRALLYLAMDEAQAACIDAEQALRLSPNLPAAHHVLGTAYRQHGRVDLAIAAYKQAAQLYLAKKDKANAHRCLEAITHLQAASARLSGSTATMATQVPMQVPQPSSPSAASHPIPRSSIPRSSMSDSSSTPLSAPSGSLITEDAFFQQVLKKIQQGNHRDALTDLDWLILTNPSHAQAYCQRGIVYTKIGRRKEAIRDLTEAIRLAPQDGQFLLHRAVVRLELEDARGAVDDLTQLVNAEAAAPNPVVYLQRGNAYCQLQDYRRAIEDYARALNLAPTNPEVYYQRAWAREAFGDRAGALGDLQQAANLWLNQGNGHQYDRVLQDIKTVQASPPVNPLPAGNLDSAGDSLGGVVPQVLDIAAIDRCNELWARLLQLVGGNQGMADRLLSLAQEYHPGKTDEWYLEKVISDLEGDR